jgi:DNA-binding transcriptional ArsR family regulator
VADLDVLLHPVRLRILQAFFGQHELTTADLAIALGDVPPASLYRHVAKLVDAGVLEVVGQRRVRGATERTYRFRPEAGLADAASLARMSPDEHRRAFLNFTAGLIAGFDQYVGHAEPIDLPRDGVSYSMSAAWLDDAEFADLLMSIATLLRPIYANGPREGRTRRLLASVFLPLDEAPRAHAAPDKGQ